MSHKATLIGRAHSDDRSPPFSNQSPYFTKINNGSKTVGNSLIFKLWQSLKDEIASPFPQKNESNVKTLIETMISA